MLLVAMDLRKRFPAVEFGASAAAGAERARSVAADGDVAKPLVKDGAEWACGLGYLCFSTR